MREMKLKERKLLKLLSMNSRFTNSELAKSILVTPQAIVGMKKRLFSQYAKPLLLYRGESLGFTTYYILLKLQSIPTNISELSKIKDVIFMYKLSGKFDYQVICYLSDEKDIQIVLKKIQKYLGDSITDIGFTKHVSEDKWVTSLEEFDVDVDVPKTHRNMFRSITKTNLVEGVKLQAFSIDEVDAKILLETLKNPQFQFSDLTESLNLTRDVVRHRMKRFIENDFIQAATIVADAAAFGYSSYCIFLKEKYPVVKYQEFVDSNKTIWYAANLFGEYTKVLYIHSKNPEQASKTMDAIKTFFGSSLAKIDLLLVEKELYSSQFPHVLLRETSNTTI
jgi:DNA-binding Lrp family transcriptional regulator